MTLEFSRQIFEKKNQIPNLMKIRLVTADLNNADGMSDRRTDRKAEANKPFSQFCEPA